MKILNIRKGLFISIFLLLFSAQSFSQDEDSVLFEQYVSASLGYNITKGLERGLVNTEVAYGFDLEGFNCEFGIQANKELFDFAYTNNSWIWHKQHTNHTSDYGLCGNIHYQRYRDISNTFDLIGGFCCRLNYPEDLSITSTIGYGLKSMGINAISDHVGRIYSHWFALSAEINKKWPNGMEIAFSISSHEKYRFPVFISPSYTLTVACNYNNFKFFSDALLRICDEFTTAPYIDRILFRAGARYFF